jgi:dihydrofolate synthase / folylpolyglutamate synthase
MTYADAIKFLYDLRWFGAILGLENTSKLAALVGNPQDKLRFIHVAGTNGKGSTCAMLESIYRASGLRVGLFISPHMVSFRERIQVNRQFISEADVVRLVSELRDKRRTGVAPVSNFSSAERKPEDGDRRDACPTFFEFVTVMALLYFAEQKCDLVIWETGLGGRLDATNIVTPLASVITNVQFDHQQWLGDTLGKIAAEKAGIIKPGVPVVTAADEPEVLRVIEQTARENRAPLRIVTADDGVRGSGPALAGRLPNRLKPKLQTVALPLLGEHQRLNATLALATVEALQNMIPVSDVAIRTGLETVQWPGRLQLVTRAGGQKIVLDGAHNVAGVQALRAALTKYFSGQKKSLILGVLQDKDWRHICEMLAPLAARIVTVPVSSERTADAHELAAACRAANPSAAVSTCDSPGDALRTTESDPFVVVTGSLYLVGEALELLGLCPEFSADERALNEWGGTPQAKAYRKV